MLQYAHESGLPLNAAGKRSYRRLPPPVALAKGTLDQAA